MYAVGPSKDLETTSAFGKRSGKCREGNGLQWEGIRGVYLSSQIPYSSKDIGDNYPEKVNAELISY